MDATALGLKIKNREISIKEALSECAENIGKKETDINAIITPMIDEAYGQARLIQNCLDEYESVLAGVPFACKDNICLTDIKTTCASKMLSEYTPPFTATALQHLLEAGGICIGKTNMDEFAMGATGETSYFGKTLNPLDYEKVPGGSSSGSAAAVAAGECYYALGSDSGGSIRLPASYCGLVGMMPSYGRVSRYGLIAHVSSMDQIGPVTRSVRDCANVLNLICRRDPMDATSVETQENMFNCDEEIKGMKVLVSRSFMQQACAYVSDTVYEAAKKLEAMGVIIEERDLSFLKDAPSVYSIISCAEASSNLARYDGIKYGGFKDLKGDTDYVCKETRRLGFGDEVKRRILFGSYVLSDGYEKLYVPAVNMRKVISRRMKEMFKEYDAVLLPVAKSVAPSFDEHFSSAKEINASDIFTVTANLAHLPAISVPFGAADGLPIGIQLIGGRFKENTLLSLAKALEG